MAMNHFSTSTDNVKKPQFAHPGKIGSGEISFSFEYFFQKTNYGLSNVDIRWFVSFLESLKIYSSYNINELNISQGRLHCHPLPFKEDSPRATLSKNDFVHLPVKQTDLFQTRIHNSHGRIVFFVYEYTIYIVLIDPHHNIYLTDKNPDIIPCYKLPKQDSYASLVLAMNDFHSRVCLHQKNCQQHEELRELTNGLNETIGNTTYIRCFIVQNRSLIEDIECAKELGIGDFSDILKSGIDIIINK